MRIIPVWLARAWTNSMARRLYLTIADPGITQHGFWVTPWQVVADLPVLFCKLLVYPFRKMRLFRERVPWD